jgi:hypothetical protein
MKMEGDLRCFCSRKPLLGKYGRDRNGLLYVWVKMFKQSRIYGEVIFTEGTVRLRCRECLRWHLVRIRQPEAANPVFRQEDLPKEISVG